MNILKKINNHYKKTNWLNIKDYLEMLEEIASQLKKDTRSRVGEVNGVDADSERDNLEDR
jgi:hypothetical protein